MKNENIISELESISYILDDEGFNVSIYDETEYLCIGIKLKYKPVPTRMVVPGTRHMIPSEDPNGNRAYDVLANSDVFDEYIDRVDGICREHQYTIMKIRKNIGPFHILIEKESIDNVTCDKCD